MVKTISGTHINVMRWRTDQIMHLTFFEHYAQIYTNEIILWNFFFFKYYNNIWIIFWWMMNRWNFDYKLLLILFCFSYLFGNDRPGWVSSMPTVWISCDDWLTTIIRSNNYRSIYIFQIDLIKINLIVHTN